ncbi:hypothetical protein V502_00852 [Pseudogymnoascus sp. VKM F-4520 (FW-2644)]|nr:hypothetical protein V502_00852 [Pseudogymnoascus sp. VKM F-4520 (FW-2644)]
MPPYAIPPDGFLALGANANDPLGLSSLHSTWFAVLHAAFTFTPTDRVSEEQWRSEIGAAMLSQQIECMPGSHRGRITHRRIVRLVGSTPPRRAVAARPGSLKREAIEAELRVERAVKRKLRVIDLGCEIPFTRIPRIVEEGFAALAKVFLRGNAGIREHYHVARNCLQECLGDPLCDVLLIIVETLSSCSVTPWVAPNAKVFEVGERKDPAQFAANLATRMLWFLRPNAFPWVKNEEMVLRITEMTKKIEHKGGGGGAPETAKRAVVAPQAAGRLHRSSIWQLRRGMGGEVFGDRTGDGGKRGRAGIIDIGGSLAVEVDVRDVTIPN